MPKPRSLRAIADLARAGVGRHGSTQTMVQFRVHHMVDRPGCYRRVLEEEQGHQYIETLTSAAHGASLIIETYDKRDAIDVHPRIDGSPRAEVLRHDAVRHVFGGVAQPNPSFLFEGTTVLEGLVSIDPAVRSNGLQRHHGATIHRLMCHIADVAADGASAPILSLQAPALVPPRQPANLDAFWPESSSLAVRFSIAIGNVSAQKRISYVRSLASYCQDNGLGLWVTDLRPNHRAGNWFEIHPHDAVRATELSRTAEGLDRPDDEMRWILPVTLVGPARVGSTQAMLKAFTKGPPAILASSITALDDLAFIHFQFGLTDTEHLAARASTGGTSPSVPRLRELKDRLRPYGIRLSTGALVDEANGLAGFTPLIGPAMPISQPPRCRPVWLLWEVDSSVGGLREMVLGLSHAMDELVRPVVGDDDDRIERHERRHYPNIEYLISRDLGVGSVRAKGKLQIPDELLRDLPLLEGIGRKLNGERPNGATDGDRHGYAGRAVAKTLEETWLMHLRRKGVNPRELRVAWREWWLGR